MAPAMSTKEETTQVNFCLSLTINGRVVCVSVSQTCYKHTALGHTLAYSNVGPDYTQHCVDDERTADNAGQTDSCSCLLSLSFEGRSIWRHSVIYKYMQIALCEAASRRLIVPKGLSD